MDTILIQVILFWGAVSFFVVATILNLVGIVFQKKDYNKILPWLAFIGFLFQTGGLILRWIQTGHIAYWGKYEVYNGYAWTILAFYLLVVVFKPNLKIIGTIVFPAAFFMIGIAILSSKGTKQIPETFLNYWLGVHIAFAKLAFGSALISAFFSAVYLVKSQALNKVNENSSYGWSMSLETADYYSYRFSIFAFITLSIMIAAGSLWAYKAWGRYWGWDPIETWSLVCWLIYGTILHLRVTLGWQGKKVAWFSIAAVPLILIAFLGIPFIYNSIHGYLSF